MAEFDIDSMISRANAKGKARGVLDTLTGQPGGGGTYNIFKGGKNDPTTPGAAPQMAMGDGMGGPTPEQMATQGDMQERSMAEQQAALERWNQAPPQMKAMFHNNFQEYLMAMGSGRDVLKEFGGGLSGGGTGPILD